jgi:hypothetical protein
MLAQSLQNLSALVPLDHDGAQPYATVQPVPLLTLTLVGKALELSEVPDTYSHHSALPARR